jgi:hypothetical protein
MRILILVLLFLTMIVFVSGQMGVNLHGEVETHNANVTMSEEEFEKEFETLMKEEEGGKKKNGATIPKTLEKKVVTKPKGKSPTPKRMEVEKKPNVIKKAKKVVPKKVVQKKIEKKKPISVPKQKVKTGKNIVPNKIRKKKSEEEMPSKMNKTPKVIQPPPTLPTPPLDLEIDLNENLDTLTKEDIITKYKDLKKRWIMLIAKLNVQQEMLNAQSTGGSNMFSGSISGPDHMPSFYQDGMFDGEDTETD